ncbi:MAG: 16S rRNA (cytosine(1402)-N(4))-methyltransferase RsmH [Verrucomicrobia bacterium]|nr:MAG: 16S rRNA (cytosine(1402)-N(4))-methyltransferase RsmH [Verrucomicrobiota bacterium]
MAGFRHVPVLPVEVVEGLAVRPGGLWVDATVGGGGHAEAILRASAPDGRLIGCDLDPEAVAAAGERLREFGERVELHEGSYVRLEEWVEAGSCDGLVADLGVSSWQLEAAERGFSFQQDGPLDMRFGRAPGPTAADLVNGMTMRQLEQIFRELGEEPRARRIAAAIVEARSREPIRTTGQLARLVERVCPRRGERLHPATRVFQALRMAVNRELETVGAGLRVFWRLLRPGGRLAVIGFHGAEIRVIKTFARELERPYDVVGEVDRPEFRRPRPPRLRRVTRRAIQPSPEEIARNPRSRSARLYVYEKLEG